ncbi:hypothetical protein OROMI_019575 [Orobanche minor]
MSPTLAAVDVAVTGVLRHRGQRRSADVDGCGEAEAIIAGHTVRRASTCADIEVDADHRPDQDPQGPLLQQQRPLPHRRADSAHLRQAPSVRQDRGQERLLLVPKPQGPRAPEEALHLRHPHAPPSSPSAAAADLHIYSKFSNINLGSFASSSASSATSLVNVGSYGYGSVAMERSFLVLANVASIVIGETGPFIKDWVTWNQVTIAAYKYQWVTSAAEEIASLAFYAIIFYMFRPVEKNEYFALDEDEELTAEMALKDEEFEL